MAGEWRYGASLRGISRRHRKLSRDRQRDRPSDSWSSIHPLAHAVVAKPWRRAGSHNTIFGAMAQQVPKVLGLLGQGAAAININAHHGKQPDGTSQTACVDIGLFLLNHHTVRQRSRDVHCTRKWHENIGNRTACSNTNVFYDGA